MLSLSGEKRYKGFRLDYGKHAHDHRCLFDSYSWVVVPEVDL